MKQDLAPYVMMHRWKLVCLFGYKSFEFC